MSEYDVIVVGGGLSSICAGYHLQKECPKKSFVILEGRDQMGGTWDLFKYPGIRSDSDMYTLGFPFYPWKNTQAIAEGSAILNYIRETAARFGIDKKIKLNHKVLRADWSDEENMWTLQIAPHNNVAIEGRTMKCKFLMMCTGYYDYAKGHDPEIPGKSSFKGTFIHPQFWDENLDYSGKNIVVIGSGATAMTLVPELAKKAAHVTMLQRTPTYVLSLPQKDRLFRLLRAFFFPLFIIAWMCRIWNAFLTTLFYILCQRFPNFIKKVLNFGVRKELGKNYDLGNFNPPYKPWDQRLCVIRDGDLFAPLRSGKASIVTDNIERITNTGILVKSGKEIPADIIVTATGLKIQLFGGMTVSINGKPILPAFSYRGVMISNCPNTAFITGYTNASWTLKADLSCQYIMRVIKYMEKKKYRRVTPRPNGIKVAGKMMGNLSSGYLKRAESSLLSLGDRSPWLSHQNYFLDTLDIKFGSISDKFLEYK